MVEIWIPYGSSEIPVRVPEERLVEILTPKKITGLGDVRARIRGLIESDGSFLSSAKAANRISIAIGACSNPSLAFEIVETLVATLADLGVPRASFTILQTVDAPPFNGHNLGEVTILPHDSALTETTELREFKGTIAPFISSTFAKSDLKILFGELKPHHFLGRSGLCDIVFPGLTSTDSVRAHLQNRKGVLAVDLYKERLNIAGSIKNLFAIGCVLDSERSPVKIAFGSIDKCLEELEQPLQDACCTIVSQSSDIVVMGVGGKPMDESLLRAVEGVPAAVPCLKREGVLIVAAECPLGHGGGEFYDWSAERKEPRYLEARLRHAFSYEGLKAVFLSRFLQSHRTYLVSTIPDHYVEGIFGMKSAPTVNSALQTAQRALGSDSTITVIPDASTIIAQGLQSTTLDGDQTSYQSGKLLHKS